jgi:two-component system sensor histidine kinase YesM
MISMAWRSNTIFARFVRVSFTIVAVVTLFSLLTIFVLRISYEQIIYDNSSELLSMTAAVLEKEVERLSELSFTIATEKEIQDALIILNNEADRLIWNRVRRELTAPLFRYDSRVWYVASLRLYDNDGTEILVGRDPYPLEDVQKALLFESAASAGGRGQLLYPDTINEYFIIARQILRTENLSLEPLGTVAIFVDFPALLNSYERLIEDYYMNIHVYYQQRLIGTSSPGLDLEPLVTQGIVGKGYRIVRLQGSRHFVAFVGSTGTQWSYFTTIPLTFLFKRILVMSAVGSIIYLALIAGIMFMAFRFARKLTIPIRELSRKMQQVESGNFNIRIDSKKFAHASDEIRNLSQDIDISLSKIQQLIRADYRKRLQIKDARFRILQTQINPHFLYNTLDSINWMAKSLGNREISTMVKSLGRLLRRSLGSTERLVSLSSECSLIQDYLAIQKVRFQEKLEVHLDVPKEVLDIKVPPFLFQPLLENSIRYSLEEGNGVCKVDISVRRNEKTLTCEVRDNGPGFKDSVLEAFRSGKMVESRGSGIGITNIVERLRAIFDEIGISIDNIPEGGARVGITFPCTR